MDKATFKSEDSILAVVCMLGRPNEIVRAYQNDEIKYISVTQGINPNVHIYFTDGTHQCWHLPGFDRYLPFTKRTIPNQGG